MRRIVYVWNYRDWGGAQLYFASLVSKTAEQFAVEVALPAGTATRILDRFRADGAKIFIINGQADLLRGTGFLNKLVRHFGKHRSENLLYRQLASRYDPGSTALHVDAGFWASLLLMLRLSRRFHTFYTIHTPLEPKSLTRSALWKVKGFIAGRRKKIHFLASNVAARKSLAPFLPASVLEQIQIAYTGIEVDEIDSARIQSVDRFAIRHRLGVTDEEFLIVLVGQFIVRKGAHVLINALPAICDAIPHARIVWLTMREPEGELADRLDEAVRTFPIRVVLEAEAGGRVGVLQTLSAGEVFALPSLDEGLPGALLEAMALGVPCIASNVGAVAEAIEHGKSGLLIRPGEPGDLARKIIEMERDPKLRRALSTSARAVAMQKFDSRNAAAVTVDEYKKHLEPLEWAGEPINQR